MTGFEVGKSSEVDEILNLRDAATLPFLPASQLRAFGKTLIVAPHADDESLGCGGLIARLRAAGQPVAIWLLSDGTLSHPQSKKFPPHRLRRLREAELREAASILGVAPEDVTYFRYTDRSVPNQQAVDFAPAVAKCRALLSELNPQTIVIPWRRDPHPDHRAASDLLLAAKHPSHRILEYPIWLFELAGVAEQPLASEVTAFRLDISSTLETKRRAIAAHRSQLTELIDDDPQGFRLSESVLAYFNRPYEIYLTPIAEELTTIVDTPLGE